MTFCRVVVVRRCGLVVARLLRLSPQEAETSGTFLLLWRRGSCPGWGRWTDGGRRHWRLCLRRRLLRCHDVSLFNHHPTTQTVGIRHDWSRFGSCKSHRRLQNAHFSCRISSLLITLKDRRLSSDARLKTVCSWLS